MNMGTQILAHAVQTLKPGYTTIVDLCDGTLGTLTREDNGRLDVEIKDAKTGEIVNTFTVAE